MYPEIDHNKTNVRDIAFKGAWTLAAAGLAYLAGVVVDLPGEWVPIATTAITVASAWVRQRLGATPPTAPILKLR